MKNYKKLFLIVLSVLTVAFISCKDKGTDQKQPFIHSDLVGTWTYYIQEYDYTLLLLLDNLDYSNIEKYLMDYLLLVNPQTDKQICRFGILIKEVEEYYTSVNLSNTEYKFNFTSKNSCSVSYAE